MTNQLGYFKLLISEKNFNPLEEIMQNINEECDNPNKLALTFDIDMENVCGKLHWLQN